MASLMIQPTQFMGIRQQIPPQMQTFSQQFYNTPIPQGPSGYSPQSMQNAGMWHNPSSGSCLYQRQYQQPQPTISTYLSAFNGNFGSMYNQSLASAYPWNSQAFAMYTAPSMPHSVPVSTFPVGTAGLQPQVQQAQYQQQQQGMLTSVQPTTQSMGIPQVQQMLAPQMQFVTAGGQPQAQYQQQQQGMGQQQSMGMQQGQQMIAPQMQQLSDLEKGRKLGSGGFGTVYVWKHKITGEEIAGKEVELKNAKNLLEEWKKIKQLRHQNIVVCFDLGMDETKIYMFMELMKTSIANIVRVEPFGENLARACTSHILDGLIYLHGQGIVHKDIKGDNVLLNGQGIAKLADFGISQYHSGGTALTATGGIVGTPFYWSPEVLNEGKHGRRSDVWAIGCTVFEMVTGKPPLAEFPPITAAMKTLRFEQKNYVEWLNVGTQLKDFLQTIFNSVECRPYAEALRCHVWLTGAM